MKSLENEFGRSVEHCHEKTSDLIKLVEDQAVTIESCQSKLEAA